MLLDSLLLGKELKLIDLINITKQTFDNNHKFLILIFEKFTLYILELTLICDLILKF